jgi:molybdopterin synthase catalytic subunit
MRVNVVYFGVLREIAGHEREEVELAATARLGDLYSNLQKRLPTLGRFDGSIALSINYQYAGLDERLHEGDEVGLLPPVSGGANASGSQVLRGEDFCVEIVHEPIETASILSHLKQPEDGALVSFEGVVRNHSRGRRTIYLEYSAYEPMALSELEKLARTAREKYPVRELRIVHRLGRLEIGDVSVLIAVASAHRAAAFDAARWIIDTLKKTVPIWKKEYFEDGAIWADGEPFPTKVTVPPSTASK